MTLEQVKEKLEEIKNRGYIQTVRRGDTGVGHTLEQAFGLTENNISGADINGEIELKAFRKNTSSMMTMFTKEPISSYGRQRDRYLLETFGYYSTGEDRDLDFYTTVSVNSFNQQGFKLEIKADRLYLVHKSVPLEVYWDYILLKKVFEEKMPVLLVVLADSRGEGAQESFFYNEAYYLKGFSFEHFMETVLAGYIKVDIRMHRKLSGTPRNHGTAFRIVKSHLYECFDIRQRLL